MPHAELEDGVGDEQLTIRAIKRTTIRTTIRVTISTTIRAIIGTIIHTTMRMTIRAIIRATIRTTICLRNVKDPPKIECMETGDFKRYYSPGELIMRRHAVYCHSSTIHS